jgi:hypothetical protein
LEKTLKFVDTDPDRPDPDLHALDADPVPDPANDADPTRSGSTALTTV